MTITTVIGIDPGESAGISWCTRDGGLVYHQTYLPWSQERRRPPSYHDLNMDDCRAHVFCETPSFGPLTTKNGISFVGGMIVEALRGVGWNITQRRTHKIPPSKWRKVLGRGSIPKEVWVDLGGILAQHFTKKYVESDDEAEANCIGIYGLVSSKLWAATDVEALKERLNWGG